jgi:hypothetical protein
VRVYIYKNISVSLVVILTTKTSARFRGGEGSYFEGKYPTAKKHILENAMEANYVTAFKQDLRFSLH